MLSVMRKTLCLLTILLCSVTECVSQSRWPLPKLKELTQADAIKRGSAKLSPEDTILLKNLTRRIIAKCIDDPGPGDPHTVVGAFSRILVRRVSLTQQGDSGLVVQGYGACMCGAVGNCPFWLIEEQQHPRVLMHAIGIQSFAFQKSQRAGRFDLVLGSHDSAMVTDLQSFQFDGTKYKRNGCASLEWADPNGDALHPPRITAERCQ